MAKLDLALVVRTVDQATRPLRNIQRTVNQVGRQTGLDRVGRDLRAHRSPDARSQRRGVDLSRQPWRDRRCGRRPAGWRCVACVRIHRTVDGRVHVFARVGEKALDMVKQLTDFTAKTPFQLEDVGAAAKMLLSFGVAGDDLIDRLQVLGDIASGATVPLKDMAAIYGKTLSKGKARPRS